MRENNRLVVFSGLIRYSDKSTGVIGGHKF